MKVLIIGGTGNTGPTLVHKLLDQGHTLTTFNRGVTPDHLPDSVERLRGDRSDRDTLSAALGAQSWDCVVDMVVYTAQEAQDMVEMLQGRTEHYIFVSSGQVYLVRDGLERPFSEDDYAGELIAAPKPNTFGYEEWLYGIGKRGAEDVLAQAWDRQRFPYTSLRLPMVNSERDPYNRLYNYILRIRDGGPILIPDQPQYPLRHVYMHDVAEAIQYLVNHGPQQHRVYNISQDETLSLHEFLGLIAEIMDQPMPELVELKRDILEANGFMPDCSPFSDQWMSELTNERSKVDLNMHYTPLRDCLRQIIHHYDANPPAFPASYRRRNAERQILR